MRANILSFLVVLAASAAAWSEEPPLKQRQYRLPPAVSLPKVEVGTVPQRLTPEVSFYIESEVPLLIYGSRNGMVRAVDEGPGPQTVKSRWIDAPEVFQKRKFTGKHIYSIEPLKDGDVEIFIQAVGVASADDIDRRTVQIAGVSQDPKPPTKPTDPPTKPVDPPTKPTSYYFMAIRPNGAASQDFAKLMALPAWAELRKAGHRVKDKTVSEAAAFGVTLPDGTTLPAIVTLAEDAESSWVVRGPVAAPTTDEGIRKLPQDAK